MIEAQNPHRDALLDAAESLSLMAHAEESTGDVGATAAYRHAEELVEDLLRSADAQAAEAQSLRGLVAVAKEMTRSKLGGDQ